MKISLHPYKPLQRLTFQLHQCRTNRLQRKTLQVNISVQQMCLEEHRIKNCWIVMYLQRKNSYMYYRETRTMLVYPHRHQPVRLLRGGQLIVRMMYLTIQIFMSMIQIFMSIIQIFMSIITVCQEDIKR